MNGNIRYGIFGTTIAGIFMGEGYNSSGWTAFIAIGLGVIFSGISYGNIEKGVKEVIRLHDLELVAKARRKRNGF